MPRGQPFTLLCQQAARLARPVAADLHAHTTASDGDWTPSQLVAAAVLARLDAVAVTDHDTTAGVADAAAFAGGRVEVVAGVEVSAEFDGREVHVLGLFVAPDHPGLGAALAAVRASRRERFRAYLAAIAELREAVEAGLGAVVEAGTSSLGRRHVAGLLVRTGVAKSHADAFRRVLGPVTPTLPPKPLLPAADAIRLIREAGGVASLAHPRPDVDEPTLARLRDLGMNAVEAAYPAAAAGRVAELREIAARLGLAVTGGSDFHAPGRADRAVGVRGVSADELARLRTLRLEQFR